MLCHYAVVEFFDELSLSLLLPSTAIQFGDKTCFDYLELV